MVRCSSNCWRAGYVDLNPMMFALPRMRSEIPDARLAQEAMAFAGRTSAARVPVEARSLEEISELERMARTSGEFAKASWELARHGRPFRALALVRAVPESDVWSTAARVLALFTAGRPDLAQQVCTHALPASVLGDGPFPGAEERHLMDQLEDNARA